MPSHLTSHCKQLMGNLIEYFESEKKNGGPLLPLEGIREKVASALKLSISTVSRVSQLAKKNAALCSPPKKRPR